MKTLLFVAFVMAVSGAGGCSDESESKSEPGRSMSFDTPQGRVNVDGADGKMKVTSADGTATYEYDEKGIRVNATDKDGATTSFEMKQVDAAAFGEMLYAGATFSNDGGAMQMKTGDGESLTGDFRTPDPPSRVRDHFKKLLPKAFVMEQGDVATMSGTSADGATYSIAISPDPDSGKTAVVVSVMKKKA